jgi:prepilin-type N-terminal cleavage/methylation domain-containing protein
MIRGLRNQKGFTLMEFMVIILILGILAAFGVPRYLRSVRTSKTGMVIANYDVALTEVSSAFYEPSSTSTSVESAIVSALNSDLTNPFSSSTTAAVNNAATPTAGQIQIDGTTTSGQITITAYDADASALSGYSKTITDPKS